MFGTCKKMGKIKDRKYINKEYNHNGCIHEMQAE